MKTFINLPEGFEWVRYFIVKKEIGKYTIHDDKRSSILITKIPIEFSLLENKKVYRLCVMYKNTCVSADNEIYDLSKMTHINQFLLQTGVENTYKSVARYNNVTKKRETALVHRLVAMCWVKNDDFKTQYVVDHKDGIKYHNHADNLEWVTPSKNASRASNKVMNKTFYVKNVNTGEIHTAHSTNEICRIIHRPKLYKRIDEMPFRYKNKHGEWIIEDKDNFHNFNVEDNTSEVSIKYPDGTIKKFKDLEALKRYLITTYDKRWITLSNSKKIKDFLDSKNIELITNKVYDEIRLSAKHLKTNLEYNGKTVAELTKLIGVSETPLRRRYKKDESGYGLVINDWLIKNDEDADYPEPRYIQKTIGLTARKGNDIKAFHSAREASRYFRVDRKTIKRKANLQEPLFGYIIKFNKIE